MPEMPENQTEVQIRELYADRVIRKLAKGEGFTTENHYSESF